VEGIGTHCELAYEAGDDEVHCQFELPLSQGCLNRFLFCSLMRPDAVSIGLLKTHPDGLVTKTIHFMVTPFFPFLEL
jgi:hypothetical protein